MVDFACKTFDMDEIIKCSLGLSRADFKLFEFLLAQDEPMTTNDISKGLGLDRSTVQKSVKSLVGKQVILRLQVNLEKGGYLFRYKIKDKDILKKNIIMIIKGWSEGAIDEIEAW